MSAPINLTQLTAPQVTAITAAINTIKTNLAAVPRVNPEVAKTLNGVENERYPFAERWVNMHCVNYPAFIPPAFTIANLNNGLAAINQYENIEQQLADVLDILKDGKLISGDQLFTSMRSGYAIAEQNIEFNTPGAQAVYDDLNDLFNRTGNRPNTPPENTNPV